MLTDSESTTAKSKLLSSFGPENNTGTGINKIGNAASRWVDLQWISYVISLIASLLVLFFFIIPFWNDMNENEAKFNPVRLPLYRNFVLF